MSSPLRQLSQTISRKGKEIGGKRFLTAERGIRAAIATMPCATRVVNLLAQVGTYSSSDLLEKGEAPSAEISSRKVSVGSNSKTASRTQ